MPMVDGSYEHEAYMQEKQNYNESKSFCKTYKITLLVRVRLHRKVEKLSRHIQQFLSNSEFS